MKSNLQFSAILVGIAALGAVTLSPVAAFAQQVTSSPGTTQGANQAARMATIKARSDAEITDRLTSLNSASLKINAATKLSSNDKSTFGSEIQTDITNLTTLKAKIDADTDITTLRADAKSIFTDFRVYAVFLPQVHELAAIDTMGVTTANLQALSAKLQSRIQTAQGNGKDVTSLQGLLSDMNTQITNAQNQYSGVEGEISPLTPASYPGSNATLQDGRSKIKSGAADLKSAFQDAKQIVQGLKALEGKTATSIPSPSSSPASTQ